MTISRQFAFQLYALGLFLAATAMVIGLVLVDVGLGSPYPVAALCLLAIFAETQSVRLTPQYEVSVASLTFIFAAVLFGPLAAVVVGAVGLLPDLARRDDPQWYLRWVVWTATRALVAGAAGAGALAVAGQRPTDLGPLLAAVLAASGAEAAADLLLAPLAPVIRGTASWRVLTRALVPLQLASVPLHV